MQGTMETARRTIKGFMTGLPFPFRKIEQQTPAPPALTLFKAIVEPYTKKGERQELHVQATTVEHAHKIFHKRGLRIISVRALRDNTPVTGAGKVSNLELAIFCKQFGQQLDSGMVPIEAIENILEESENKNFRQALSIIVRDLQKGMTVSEAFTRHPGVFDPVFLALVQSGEEAGKLPDMMEVLYRRAESAGKLQRTLKQAMIYPAILILVGSLVLLVIYWKVMPKWLERAYAQRDDKLPQLKGDPLLRSLRSDPRWSAFLKKMRLPAD
jgi:type II secretory pathway component PulF